MVLQYYKRILMISTQIYENFTKSVTTRAYGLGTCEKDNVRKLQFIKLNHTAYIHIWRVYRYILYYNHTPIKRKFGSIPRFLYILICLHVGRTIYSHFIIHTYTPYTRAGCFPIIFTKLFELFIYLRKSVYMVEINCNAIVLLVLSSWRFFCIFRSVGGVVNVDVHCLTAMEHVPLHSTVCYYARKPGV